MSIAGTLLLLLLAVLVVMPLRKTIGSAAHTVVRPDPYAIRGVIPELMRARVKAASGATMMSSGFKATTGSNGGSAVAASEFEDLLSPMSASDAADSWVADAWQGLTTARASLEARRAPSALIEAMSSFGSADTLAKVDMLDTHAYADRSLYWNGSQPKAHDHGAHGRYLQP